MTRRDILIIVPFNLHTEVLLNLLWLWRMLMDYQDISKWTVDVGY